MCLVCGLNGKAFFSLKAVRMHMLEKGHCRISTEGVNALELIDFYDFTKVDDQPELIREGLSEDEPVQADDQGYEMVLPSGAVLGCVLLLLSLTFLDIFNFTYSYLASKIYLPGIVS